MVEQLREYVRHRVYELDVRNSLEEADSSKVRFSVTVDDMLNRRLQFCAHRLEITRAELATSILHHAIKAVEEELGITTPDQAYSDYLLTPDNDEIALVLKDNPYYQEIMAAALKKSKGGVE